jgi:proliferating cell nuclear antigen
MSVKVLVKYLRLEIETDDIRLMSNIFEALGAIVDEAIIIASPDALRASALDNSRIAMAEMFLPKEAFEVFKCEEEIEFGVNIKDMNTILGLASPGDSLKLTVTSNQINVALEGNATKRISLDLLDLGEANKRSITSSLPLSFRLSSKVFANTIKTAELGGEAIELRADENGIVFKTESGSKHVSIELTKGSEGLPEADYNVPEEGITTYPFRYLKDFSKLTKATEDLAIEFATKKPLKITYEIAEGYIIYLLAPRIDST